MLAAFACVSCGGSPVQPGPSPAPVPPGPIIPFPGPIPGLPQVFVGAGDIAQCTNNAEATARLLDNIGGTVFTTGDNAYFHGTRENYRDCYEPTWGRHKARTRPSPGNHEYESPGAAAYFDYFGLNAGPRGLGYYTFELGSWYVISLNSNMLTQRGSIQGTWLSAVLEETSSFRCTIAYWHHPLFSSGPNGDTGSMRDFWRLLYDAGVEIVLNGHDHLYERFAPQDPDGRPDPVRGIRQFTVGTGGASLYTFPTQRPNSEMRISGYGVLKLTLSDNAYEWEFVPVAGQRDSGSGRCH